MGDYVTWDKIFYNLHFKQEVLAAPVEAPVATPVAAPVADPVAAPVPAQVAAPVTSTFYSVSHSSTMPLLETYYTMHYLYNYNIY